MYHFALNPLTVRFGHDIYTDWYKIQPCEDFCMDIFFSPLACSMAARIAVYEAGASANFVEVDPKTKRMPDGVDFLSINPLGLVPAIRTAQKEILTENAAILQYIADLNPATALAPPGGMARSRLHQWLCFIGTELHKALFVPLFNKNITEEERQRVLAKGESRLRYLNEHLSGREYLLDAFSVADAYLFTVLNWTIATPVDLKPWPAIKSYYDRIKQRPSVAQALAEESRLYAEELKRHKAA
jgi:glutathione S-transferase